LINLAKKKRKERKGEEAGESERPCAENGFIATAAAAASSLDFDLQFPN
jgi:hypothetical protein